MIDDLWIFDIKFKKWRKSNDLVVNWNEKILPPLMHHTMCGVIPADISNLPNISIFNHPEFMSDMNNVRKLKIGIYI